MTSMHSSASNKSNEMIQHLRDALNNVPACVYMKDTESLYTYGNKMTLQMFDCTEAELIGQDDSQFFPVETATHLRAVNLRVLKGECTQEEVVVANPDGSRNIYWEVETPIYDAPGSTTIVGILGISTDITHRGTPAGASGTDALTDELTQLPNHRLLLDRLKQALLNSYRQITYGAVLFLELDNFKESIAGHGHETGERLLIEVAKRLRKVTRNADTIARLDGGKFVILLEGLGPEYSDASEYADMVGDKIHHALNKPYLIGKIRLHSALSSGTRIFLGETDPNEVLHDAQASMLKIKFRNGR